VRTPSWAVLFLAACCLAAGLTSAGCDLQHTSGAAPEPVATPAPVAPATPTVPTVVYGCGIPRGTGLGRDCPRESPEFMDAMNGAIDKTLDEHPEFFAGGINVGAYMDEVVENLRRAGFCALNDGEEIAVKKNNDFSEQYDIISSGGHVLRAYMATCRPAWDAIPPAGDNS
jgi:hypothetical protein